MKQKSLTIYCASSRLVDTKYIDAAHEVGRLSAVNGWRIYNGGGNSGLMAATTDGCQSAGGYACGIIPQWMIERGWLHEKLDEVLTTTNMAERKKLLRDNCDAVVVLPGGIGTMEELFETATQKQLGKFKKPIIILNQDGYYDHLEAWTKQCENKRFLRYDGETDLWVTIQNPSQLFPLLKELIP